MRAVLLVLLLTLAACVRAQGCTAQQIYDGAYIWQSFGWDTTIVAQDNTHQFNGKPSVCWTASMYTGIYFKYSSTLTASSFASLNFVVNGYSGGQDQRVEFYYNGAIVGLQPLIKSYTGGQMPATWTAVSIPLADFGLPAGQLIDGVVFQSNTGSATLQNLLCYNNVSLQCGAPGSAPTPPPPANFAGSANSPNGPYSVSGNKILDKDGNEHIFRGWARPSLEWNAQGEGLGVSDLQKQAATGANVVRFSLNQNFWLAGANGYDANYKTVVQTQVTNAKAAGMSVILDLHWSNKGALTNAAGQQVMADAYSVQFWQEVAAAYKTDPEVLFELYNEPHDVPCSVWRDGGSGAWGFTVAGMQQLYSAVRGTGAANLVIVGGLDYAYDLTCVKTYPLSGTNIVYNTHPYFNFNPKGTPADWDAYVGFLFPASPVMATEFGNFDCSTAAYVTWLNYTAAHKVHWTAWAWYPQGCGFPSLINSWAGDLTAPGQLVANALYANRPGATGATAAGAAGATATGTNGATVTGTGTGSGSGSGGGTSSHAPALHAGPLLIVVAAVLALLALTL